MAHDSADIPVLNWPTYGQNEADAVQRVISSNQLFSHSEVQRFESEYSKFINARHSLAVGNATQGLHLALAALNIGIGDEVIVPPYSWISTASCVLMQNAVPIFCDIEPYTFSLDLLNIQKLITSRTKAVILVHVFGYPSKYTFEIRDLCESKGISLIEDNSHAHGAAIDGLFTGSIGTISVASLHQRKALSVGDGGIISTNDDVIAEKIYKLRSFGHPELSYNYRMTEFAGALGQIALAKLDSENEVRSSRAKIIANYLSDITDIRVLLPSLESTRSVYYAVLIIIDGDQSPDLKKLPGCEDISTAPIRYTWSPLHFHSHFSGPEPARGYPWNLMGYTNNCERSWSIPTLPVAEHYLPNKIIEFYVHPTMSDKHFHILLNAIYHLLSTNS